MMSKRLKAFAYEVLTSGQSHGKKGSVMKMCMSIFSMYNHPAPPLFQCFVFYSVLRAALKIKVLSPCRGSNHEFMLSFHFSSVEAIYMVSHDCTPISAHSNVSLTTRTLLQRSCGGVLLMEFKSSHVPSLIQNIRRISLR